MKLMMIDGNSIINRAFYGIRMLNAPDGTPTNGVYGFITIMQRLLDEEKPDGVCAAFDLRAPTFRHLKYEGYKAQRKPMPEELAVQMPIIKSVLDAMGIMRVECEGLEADDLLGTMSRMCQSRGDEAVIVTGDRDSFQLITDKTRVLHVKTARGKTETISYTPERFFEEYGFTPEKIVDLKALMGDASDNIPGVPGVGEKTALELVRRFGSLNAIYEQIDSAEIREGVRKKLLSGRESALMSYELATIVTDAPLDVDLERARWSYSFTPELYDVFLKLGFTKFIEKYRLSPAEHESAGTSPDAFGVFSLKTDEDVRAAAARLSERPAFALLDGSLNAALMADGENEVFTLASDFSGNRTQALRQLFAAPSEITGHNIKDCLRRLIPLGIDSDAWRFDTALAAYLLDASAGSYSLDSLCVKYCGFQLKRTEEENAQLSLLDAPAEPLSELAAEVSALPGLRAELEKRLEALSMTGLYREIELPLCRVLADMELAGFFIDRSALREYGDSLSSGIAALEQRVWDEAGEKFNINSPRQLGTVLFEKLMLPSGRKTKTGWSTNADVLEKLRGKHPIIQDVLDYRTLSKLKSTYADGLLKVIDTDGRIRTSFQMTVTATGRLSSTEPNLQNIPVRRELGAQIRRMFAAEEGKVLVDADYSQIELRLLAHISGDERLIEAFRSGEDIHAVTASQVFGVPLEEVTPLQRSRAKAVNFGIVYGISAWSLAQDIGVSQAEARAYMDSYLEKYSGVRAYMKSIVERARENGYVDTLFFRRRYLPELKSSNHAVRSFGERVALNMPIQGTAADIIKLAMVRVHSRLRAENLSSRLILQVHDELIAECPEAEAAHVAELIEREMENVVSLSVPLTAKAHIGKTWAEAH